MGTASRGERWGLLSYYLLLPMIGKYVRTYVRM